MTKTILWFGLIGLFIVSSPGIVQAGESQEITLTARVEAGSKVWVPAAVTISKGKTATLRLENTTEAEHGFSIDELGITEVVGPHQTKKVGLPTDKPGTYRFYCQLHKAHVGGELKIQ